MNDCDIKPIEVSIRTIYALTRACIESRKVRISHEPRKVVIKFHTGKSICSGPCITIGCNAVIQYNGSLRDFSYCYSTMCSILTANMNTPEFINSITNTREIVNPIYPAGKN